MNINIRCPKIELIDFSDHSLGLRQGRRCSEWHTFAGLSTSNAALAWLAAAVVACCFFHKTFISFFVQSFSGRYSMLYKTYLVWFLGWVHHAFESCQPSKVPTAVSTQPIISEILTRVFPGPRLSSWVLGRPESPLGLLMQLASSASVDGRAAGQPCESWCQAGPPPLYALLRAMLVAFSQFPDSRNLCSSAIVALAALGTSSSSISTQAPALLLMLFHDVPALPAEVWMPALPLLDYLSGFSKHALDSVTRLRSLASGGFWTAPRLGGQMASPPNAPGTTWSICPPKRGAVLACVWWHWWLTVWFCSYSPQVEAQLGANMNKAKQ